MQRSSVFVTGASGFIGSHVARHLAADGAFQVIAVARREGKNARTAELASQGAVLVEGNFYDETFLHKTFRSYPIRHVVHLAGIRGAGAATWEEYERVNVLGTETLLQHSLAHGVERFLLFSTVGVYGTIPSDLPAGPATKLRGDNTYHASKVLAEERARDYSGKGMKITIFRPTITYGPGDNGFSETLVRWVKRGMLPLPSPDIQIHLLDVKSLAGWVCEALKKEQMDDRVFIAADRAPVSLRRIANSVYAYYHQRDYPSFVRCPSFLLRAGARALRILRNEKWATRMSLLSRSWYYDTQEILEAFQAPSADTEVSFVRSMCHSRED